MIPTQTCTCLVSRASPVAVRTVIHDTLQILLLFFFASASVFVRTRQHNSPMFENKVMPVSMLLLCRTSALLYLFGTAFVTL